MRKFTSGLLTALLVICAILVVTALIRPAWFAGQNSALSSKHDIPNWRSLASKGHRVGPVTAAVTILEFSDFQCEFCARAQQALREVRAEYPTRLALVYRHAPASSHPHAREAALASECAAAQGRFAEFHDLLFGRQDSIGRTPWEDFARRAKVGSIAGFKDCLASAKFDGRVSEDIEAARSLRLRGTPTFIINGKMLVGSPAAEDLRREVEAALERPS